MEQYFRNRASVDDDPDLARNRRANDARLKSRFEHIFAKYEKDFEGVGDEIDLETGEIFVNNGHLKNMRHEVDPGRVVSSQVLQVLGNSLERRDRNVSREEDTDEWEGGESSSASDDPSDGSEEESEASRTAQEAKDELSSDFYPEDQEMTPRQRQPQPTRRNHNSHTTLEVDNLQAGGTSQETSRSGTPGNPPMDLPSFDQSLQAMQGRPGQNGSIDQDTIYALGQSIANQLARRMKGASRKRPQRRRDQDTDRASPWEYPVLPGDQRIRSPSPAKPMSSSAAVFAASPEHGASIWAPSQRPRSYKRRHRSSKHVITGGALTEKEGDVDPLQIDRPRQHEYSYLERDHEQEPGHLSTPEDDGAPEDASDLYEIPATPASNRTPGYSANTGRRLTGVIPRMGPFTVIEEELVIKYREIDGLPWKAIGNLLPNRSAFSAQSHYSRACKGVDCDARRLLRKQGFPVEQFLPPDAASSTSADEGAVDDPFEDMPEPAVQPHASMSESRTARPSVNLLEQQTQPESTGFTTKDKGVVTDDESGYRRFARFTPQEDELILRLRHSGNMTWDQISWYFPGRTPMALQKHYTRELATESFDDGKRATSVVDEADNVEPLQYTQEEDDLITEMRDEEDMSFEEMTDYLIGRSEQALQDRYEYLKRDRQLPENGPKSASMTQGSGHRHGPEESQSQNQMAPPAPRAYAASAHTSSGRTEISRTSAAPFRPSMPQTPLASTKPNYNSSRSSQVGPSAWATTQPASKGPLPFQPARKGLVPLQPETPWLGPTDPFHPRSAPVQRTRNAMESGIQPRAASTSQPPSIAESSGAASHQANNIDAEDPPTVDPSLSAAEAGPDVRPPSASAVFIVETTPGNPENAAAHDGAMAASEDPEGDSQDSDFTPEQDAFIRKARENRGLSWADIAVKLPGHHMHSSQAITSRYYDVIVTKKASAKFQADTINTGPERKHKQRYTDEESEKVAEYREKGMSWVEMAALLPGRPPISIQNHYYSSISGSAKQRKPQSAHLTEQRSAWSAPLLRQALDNSTRRLSATHDDTTRPESSLHDIQHDAGDASPDVSQHRNVTSLQAERQEQQTASVAGRRDPVQLAGEDNNIDPALRDAQTIPMQDDALATPALLSPMTRDLDGDVSAALGSPEAMSTEEDGFMVQMSPHDAIERGSPCQAANHAAPEEDIIYEGAPSPTQAAPGDAQANTSGQRPRSFEKPGDAANQQLQHFGQVVQSESIRSSPPAYTEPALRNGHVHRHASPELGAAYGTPAKSSHQTNPYYFVPNVYNQDIRQMRQVEESHLNGGGYEPSPVGRTISASGPLRDMRTTSQAGKQSKKKYAEDEPANPITSTTKRPAETNSPLSGTKRKRMSGRSQRVNSHEVADSDSDSAYEEVDDENEDDTEGLEEDSQVPRRKRRSTRPRRPRDYYIDESLLSQGNAQEREEVQQSPAVGVKRKRGRPRKHPIQSTEEHNTETSRIPSSREAQESSSVSWASKAAAEHAGSYHQLDSANRDHVAHDDFGKRSQPQLDWLNVISSALRSRPDNCMRTREVVAWVKEQHPYFRDVEEATWVHRVSNLLVRRPIFRKFSTSKHKGVWTFAHSTDDGDAECAIPDLDGTHEEEHENDVSTKPPRLAQPSTASTSLNRDNTEVIDISSDPPEHHEPPFEPSMQKPSNPLPPKPQQSTPRAKGPRHSDTGLLRQATAMATPARSDPRRSSLTSRLQTPLRFRALMMDEGRGVRAESVARWDAPLGRRVVLATGVGRDDKDGAGEGEGQQDELS